VERPLVFIRAEFQRGLVAYLLGEVSEQGAYPVLEEMRVSEFIAKYGGVNTGAADLSEVRVLTEEGEVYRVDLEEILDGDVESDLKVHPGDRIFVPEEGVSGLDRTLRVAQLVSLLFQIATIAIVLAQ
jgi:protein involved in polysaccharide export with SLBB domain